MNLRLPDPTGHIDIGDSALVRLSVEEVLDPLTGAVIQAAIPSGVQPFYMRYEVPSEKLNNFKLRRRWKCSLSFVEVVFQSLSGVCSGSSTWKRLRRRTCARSQSMIFSFKFMET